MWFAFNLRSISFSNQSRISTCWGSQMRYFLIKLDWTTTLNFPKKRYLCLVLKCPPLIIDKHYSLSCSTCDGGGANISNITKLSTLKKNLLALHLYLYPCITITNTCYTTSKLSWSHCSIRVKHHLLKGLGACYLDIMVDCSDKFCNFTVVFKVRKYQS